ncbi:LOW QUALITY PROTEIN: uncharacterized protein LOC129323462 [Eublepharis macularius]|uniref:ribonuclease H n=1 Tax=Eublepharis macularius TaxID=481883 RepID=A0AA97IUU4_EUBMA|nr:LOW QUALITY PROTEIN: uncharacterized protein LOC129323462 [Eublepharis macularius]
MPQSNASIEDSIIEVNPQVWAAPGNPAKAKGIPLIEIKLKSGKGPVQVKQYPLSQEGCKGLKPIIQDLINEGKLEPCASPFNTPILAIPKGPEKKKWRLVQDLRAVNSIVESRFPIVPNPHTLLVRINPSHSWYSVVDLKDAYFSLELHENSRDLFAFEWEDPDTHVKHQLRWTVLPQGFVDSPVIFGTTLEKALLDWPVPEGVQLLQFVDDLLLSGSSKQALQAATVSLLNFLGEKGYRVSKEKAQLCKEEVSYLGHRLHQGTKRLAPERCEAICRLPLPKTKKQLRAALGMTGYCRSWILDYGILTQSLIKKTAASEPEQLVWNSEEEATWKKLKQALMSAPALGLSDLSKPFELFVYEKQGCMTGVLTQKWGPTMRPVAYLSRQLDPVARGWPACLREVAAVSMALKDCLKMTLGGTVRVHAPHAVPEILQQRGAKWLTNSHLIKYEAQMIENDGITIQACNRLNPATLLPYTDEKLIHDCLENIDEATMARIDLKDQPLENAENEFFVDGSSFMEEGKRYTGYSVVTEHETVKAGPLPASWSAQAAELHALARALLLSKATSVNVYTDSKYAFGVVHAFGALWKERGFLTANGTPVQNQERCEALLSAIQEPKQVAVIHIRGHQKGGSKEARGNRRADEAAKKGAKGAVSTLCPLVPAFQLPPQPKYSVEERHLAEKEGGIEQSDGWICGPDGRPSAAAVQPLPLEFPVYSFQPGEWVLIKSCKDEPLTPKWKGPYQVLLIADAAVKTTGSYKWIHHTRVKKTTPPVENEEADDGGSAKGLAAQTGAENKEADDGGTANGLAAQKGEEDEEQTRITARQPSKEWEVIAGEGLKLLFRKN